MIKIKNWEVEVEVRKAALNQLILSIREAVDDAWERYEANNKKWTPSNNEDNWDEDSWLATELQNFAKKELSEYEDGTMDRNTRRNRIGLVKMAARRFFSLDKEFFFYIFS